MDDECIATCWCYRCAYVICALATVVGHVWKDSFRMSDVTCARCGQHPAQWITDDEDGGQTLHGGWQWFDGNMYCYDEDNETCYHIVKAESGLSGEDAAGSSSATE